MKKRFILLFVVAMLLSDSVISFADDMYRGAWYGVPGINYNSLDSNLNSEDDIGIFLRGGKEVSEKWDLQFGASYISSKSNNKESYKQRLLGVDALYMFSREKLRPFLLVGFGYSYNKVGHTDSSDGAMMGVGAGAQYLVSDAIGLQVDIREVWTGADVGNLATTNQTKVANTLFNLGVIYRFGVPVIKPEYQSITEVVAQPATVTMSAVQPPPDVAAEPTKVPKPIVVPCVSKSRSVVIQTEILFDFDKYVIKSNKDLDKLISEIRLHGDSELILVTGHTDPIGNNSYNQKLSERRANVVKNYLVQNGVDATQIQVIGKGESELVLECKNVRGTKKIIECLAPNRRVVIDSTPQGENICEGVY
jgi:OmpA-OmpF porin, OOP family